MLFHWKLMLVKKGRREERTRKKEGRKEGRKEGGKEGWPCQLVLAEVLEGKVQKSGEVTHLCRPPEERWFGCVRFYDTARPSGLSTGGWGCGGV